MDTFSVSDFLLDPTIIVRQVYMVSQGNVFIVTTDCHPDVLNFLSINAALNLGPCQWRDADLRRFLNDPPVIFEDGANQTKGGSNETPVEIRWGTRTQDQNWRTDFTTECHVWRTKIVKKGGP